MIEPVTIREAMNRRLKWLPLGLLLGVGAVVLCIRCAPQNTVMGKVVAALTVGALMAFLQWVGSFRCPRCGQSFLSAYGGFYWKAFTGQWGAQCDKCGLDIDEDVPGPTS